MSEKTTKSVERDIETVSRLLGEHPEDLLFLLTASSERFGWLGEIFQAIRRLEEEQGFQSFNNHRICRLASLGGYLADDFDQLTDSNRESMRECLAAAGVNLSVQEKLFTRMMVTDIALRAKEGES